MIYFVADFPYSVKLYILKWDNVMPQKSIEITPENSHHSDII